MFFSEEKNQKTFMFSAASTYPAMAWICTRAQTQESFGSFLQKRTFLFLTVSFLAGCTGNPANVRTLANGIQTVAGDAPNIVAADKASCAQSAALQTEFMQLEAANLGGAQIAPPDCAGLAAVLDKILAENTAIQAYGAALGSLAQDQFVTTTADAGKVAGTLKSLDVPSPVTAAVNSVFALVEGAALKGYRQAQLRDVLTGEAAQSFKIVVASYGALASQYAGALARESANIGLMEGAVAHFDSVREPIAVAEMKVRFEGVRQDAAAKKAAVDAFVAAISGLDPAFDAAARDVTEPNPKMIYDDVSAFAKQVQDAHEKLKAAFGAH
jgi:hypothetical protein